MLEKIKPSTGQAEKELKSIFHYQTIRVQALDIL
jgi:hypothetical protein